MDAGPLRDVLTVLAGVGTGVLSAAFGVGGAVVSTPAIRALGASASIAVGTTLPSILPSAITGTIRYAKDDLIDWNVVRWTAPAGVVSAVAGSLLSKVIPGEGHWLMVLTALLLGFTAWRMARQQPAPPAQPPAEAEERAPVAPPEGAARRTPLTFALIGVSAGMLSGLLGVGGGILMVPTFTEVAKLPIKPSVATSLACVGVFAVPGTITHTLLGGVDWRYALLLGLGVIPGARLGAAAAIKATDRRLRLVVASFLGLTSVLYLAGELAAL